MTVSIIPVVLCGGSGKRLWPMSRKARPKQFADIFGDKSLFQMTLDRLAFENSRFKFQPSMLLTNSDFRFDVAMQAKSNGSDLDAIFLEPEGKNTAAAILVAALAAQQNDPHAILLMCPSDHLIEDDSSFYAAIEAAIDGCDAGDIITFGIAPTHPSTAYGYIHAGDERPDGCRNIIEFVEKPQEARAREMLATNRYFWNAGIFMMSVSTAINAFAHHAPDMLALVQQSLATAHTDLDFLRLGADAWQQIEDISFDYAIMEKAKNLAVVPLESDWTDLGGWEAIYEQMPKDANANALQGNVIAESCENTLIRSDVDNFAVLALGLQDVAVVATKDALLVADIHETQALLKLGLEKLAATGACQVESFSKEYRPWGSFESLAQGGQYQVKHIIVQPGEALSLQSHEHRAEHWIVVRGRAQVTIGDEVQILETNQSCYIPILARHRLENPFDEPIELIEVQTGSYLGEDDIIRYEDKYRRDA